MTIQTETLGYPRIGKNREVKKALELFWKGKIEDSVLLQSIGDVESSNWQTQLTTGIDRIGIGDTTLYDHVLDWSIRLGLIPKRFRHLEGLDRYFAMARGTDGIPALEMTKWFDTNYHYLVPEIELEPLPANFSDFLATARSAKVHLGDRAIPIVLGLVTVLRLSRLGLPIEDLINSLTPRYVGLLTQLKALGITEIQIHDPVLVWADSGEFRALFEGFYKELAAVGLSIHLVTYFDDLGAAYPWVMELPVAAISLDFTRGQNLDLLKEYGFPADKRLGVGIVDARNVWRTKSDSAISLLSEIKALTDAELVIQPSASLQFVPYDVARETNIPEPLRNVLSFAEQKLEEVVNLAVILSAGTIPSQQDQAIWQEFYKFNPADLAVQSRLQNIQSSDFERSLSYINRRADQVQLPLFPTTTIGSFPQTTEVRQLRMKYKRGELSLAGYQIAIDSEISQSIQIQEDVGLDVFVHGEFERTDMVEFFGQQLTGFSFTENGWVQSYGSRYVRPPIISGDISRPNPMTIREFEVAQSLTQKPVKGMLTAPITILNWSYPRTDITRKDQAFQIALAIRDEVSDLERAGARIIQVDEPALREGLPLKPERWHEYLSWAVDSFRLATAVVQPQTQIHTHMCYCEFGDIIQDIQRLDADVLSIENSRSGNRTLEEIADGGYTHQVGNGVYDIHSPVIPNTDQMVRQLRAGLTKLPLEQIWVNPDCGLKTRSWEEVLPALRNMVDAAKIMRNELDSTTK
jgi:5-methyltetrahydropteroyltriglutamate--homocysteine methyltransferase